MVNNTEEKGLVKVNDSIFAKIRRFFMLKFGRKQIEVEQEVTKLNNEENVTEESINEEQNSRENENTEINENLNTQQDLDQQTPEQKEEIYESKEEIEIKLMNYYESIKKSI